MGREALEITKRRMIDGHSPADNFGGMPHGWLKSTGNNQKLVMAGRRSRGRHMTLDELAATAPDPSVAPPTTVEVDVHAADSMGLAWIRADASPPARDDVGVYRIATAEQGPLDYLGQGLIAARWATHAKGWALDPAAEDGDGRWDWAGLPLGARELLEVANDLIAGHVHVFARVPRADRQIGGTALGWDESEPSQ